MNRHNFTRCWQCFVFVFFLNSPSINSVKLEQMRKVSPAKILLIQVSNNFFDQSEAPLSCQANKYKMISALSVKVSLMGKCLYAWSRKCKRAKFIYWRNSLQNANILVRSCAYHILPIEIWVLKIKYINPYLIILKAHKATTLGLFKTVTSDEFFLLETHR